MEVGQRVMSSYEEMDGFESAIFDTIYEERRRLDDEPVNKLTKRQAAFYDRVYRKAARSKSSQKRLLRQMTDQFAKEVLGDFDPLVYSVTSKVMPPALGLLLNSLSPLRLFESFQDQKTLTDQLVISGDVEGLKRATKLGTVVLVPTHISNLDSFLSLNVF
jgi:glycerol-3-phosphate O-acyltransferase